MSIACTTPRVRPPKTSSACMREQRELPVDYRIVPALEIDAYHELCAYTLTHSDPAFIHQHVVDAFAAQNADENTKPIALTFALAGLYLHVEKGRSGREVQLAHARLAQRKRQWPTMSLPRERGEVTAAHVMRAAPGAERDTAIDAWCVSVWSAFHANEAAVVALLDEYGI
jgi:Family of unknown function (DUF5946)